MQNFGPTQIADGSSYREGSTYFFFDPAARVVRSTQGLRRMDAEFLGSSGVKAVLIERLHTKFADAVDAGQDSILQLERSKPKAEQSMKRILMARGL